MTRIRPAVGLNRRRTTPPGGVRPRGARVVVREIVFRADDGGFCYRSGRFSTHLDLGVCTADGPHGLLLDEAIGWARSQADVVILHTGDPERRFSAGRRQPIDGPLPEWPLGGHRGVATA